MLLARAAGEPARAVAMARSLLPQFEVELKAKPDSHDLWHFKALVLAVLGQERLALESQAKAVAGAGKSGNLYMAELVRRDGVSVHALLGQRDKALEMLRDEVKRPGALIHDRRVSLMLASLWDDPDFLAIVNDPASVAPLPLTTKL